MTIAKLNAESSLQIAKVNAATSEHKHVAEMWGTILSAGAWPLAAVIIAVTFHRYIKNLIDKVSDFEGFGVKAKFGEQISELAEQVAEQATHLGDDAPAPGPVPADGEDVNDDAAPEADSRWRSNSPANYQRLLAEGAIPAILEGWRSVERAIRELAARSGLTSKNAASVVRELWQFGFIDPETYEQINRARRLRNQVVHEGSAVTMAEAALYVQTTAALAERLSGSSGSRRGPSARSTPSDPGSGLGS